MNIFMNIFIFVYSWKFLVNNNFMLFLQKWYKIIICSSCDNNYVAKIDILSSAALIFIKISWIILYTDYRQ